MPKAKPTQVIVHRIELQEKERDLIQQYMQPKIIQGYAKTAGIAGAVVIAGGVGYAAYELAKSTTEWMGAPIKGISKAVDATVGFGSFLLGASLSEASGVETKEGSYLTAKRWNPKYRWDEETQSYDVMTFDEELNRMVWVPENP